MHTFLWPFRCESNQTKPKWKIFVTCEYAHMPIHIEVGYGKRAYTERIRLRKDATHRKEWKSEREWTREKDNVKVYSIFWESRRRARAACNISWLCVLPFPNLLLRIVLVCCTVVAIFFIYSFFYQFAQSFFPFCVFLSLAYYLLEISLSYCNAIAFPFIGVYLCLYVKFTILRQSQIELQQQNRIHIANEIETNGKYQCT